MVESRLEPSCKWDYCVLPMSPNYCRFCFLSNFSAPYLGNLWLVQVDIVHCSLWSIQTISFLGMAAGRLKGSEIDSM